MKGKKEEVMTVDGDQFRYFLLAGEKYQVYVRYISRRKIYHLFKEFKKELYFFVLVFVLISCLFEGTSHPYPDDTFYSVGRVPRKLLMK